MSPYKKIRRASGMTLEELAQKMLLPVDMIRHYENRFKQPSLHFKSNFKSIFNVTDADLEQEGIKCQ